MSDKTPIQLMIEYFAENLCGVQVMLNETGGNTPANRITENLLKQVIADLKKFIPIEKQFARDAFDAGEEHDVSITRCCDINMPETNPDFSTYYKKYE